MHINQGLSEELFRLFTNIGQANQAATTKPRLSPVEYTLLVTLAQRPRRGSDLICVVGLDQSTVSRRISAFVEDGLVDRIPDPDDGRAQLVRLTKAGEDLVQTERARRVRTLTDAIDDWSDTDRQDLTRLLSQLNDSLEARRGPALKEPRV